MSRDGCDENSSQTGWGSGMKANSGAALVASALLAEWTRANLASDVKSIMALYTADALLFGSQERLFVGRDAIASYFDAIPEGCVTAVDFSEVSQSQPIADMILVGAYVDFHLDIDGIREVLAWRIMLSLVHQEGTWLIASHHAAPRNTSIKLAADA